MSKWRRVSAVRLLVELLTPYCGYVVIYGHDMEYWAMWYSEELLFNLGKILKRERRHIAVQHAVFGKQLT